MPQPLAAFLPAFLPAFLLVCPHQADPPSSPPLPAMFDRQSLHTGAYLRHFDHLPPETVWSPARIEASLERFLAQRPAGCDETWLFAYGSLIWNPMLAFDDRVGATLAGWHRSFCMRMLAGRATPCAPGRMLSLEPGGQVDGIALRIAAERWREELAGVWVREMVTGAYVPAWLPLTLHDGRRCDAVVFTVNPHEDHWEGDSRPEQIAPLISAASGPFGSNADYVYRLQSALAAEALEDDYVDALAAALGAGRVEGP